MKLCDRGQHWKFSLFSCENKTKNMEWLPGAIPALHFEGGHESKKRKEKQGQNFTQISFFKEIQRVQFIRNKTIIMY